MIRQFPKKYFIFSFILLQYLVKHSLTLITIVKRLLKREVKLHFEMNLFLFELAVIFCILSTTSGFSRALLCKSSIPLRITSKRLSSSNIDRSASVAQNDGKIDLLFDSECPICMMEVNFLKKRDIDSRIKFTDLQSPSYNPAEHGNVKFADGMRKLRAVLPNGNVVMGVEVFRKTYEAIGLGWVFELTKLPVFGQIADNLYDLWAENRLRLTGRPELAEVLKQRAEELAEAEEVSCDSDGCGIDYSGLDDPEPSPKPNEKI